MIDYAIGTKAYQLWDPKRQKVILSRDIIFDERPFSLPPGVSRMDLTGFDINDPKLSEGVAQVGDAWDKPDLSKSATNTPLNPSSGDMNQKSDAPQHLTSSQNLPEFLNNSNDPQDPPIPPPAAPAQPANPVEPNVAPP
jgi:hypothetical protein